MIREILEWLIELYDNTNSALNDIQNAIHRNPVTELGILLSIILALPLTALILYLLAEISYKLEKKEILMTDIEILQKSLRIGKYVTIVSIVFCVILAGITLVIANGNPLGLFFILLLAGIVVMLLRNYQIEKKRTKELIMELRNENDGE